MRIYVTSSLLFLLFSRSHLFHIFPALFLSLVRFSHSTALLLSLEEMAKRSDARPYDLYFDMDEALTMPEPPVAAPPAPDLQTVFTAGVCTVCLEPFDAGKGAKRMPCGHLYHDTCISTWLAQDRSCPICRCPLKAYNWPRGIIRTMDENKFLGFFFVFVSIIIIFLHLSLLFFRKRYRYNAVCDFGFLKIIWAHLDVLVIYFMGLIACL